MTSNPPLDAGELYRVLAESASDAIVTIDGESIVLSINPAGEALFGYSAAELLGTSLTRLMPTRHHAGHRVGMTHYLKTGKRRIAWKGVRLSVLTKAGDEIPVEISFGEFVSAGRHIFSAVMRDVSDRVTAEATLAANAEQLQGQAVELERQVEEAQAGGEELEHANEELHQTNVALELARADAEAAVARLRSQEAEFRALANSMPTLAWMAKPDGWIFWYNDRWYEYTGTAPADMEGWGWKRVHDPQTLPHVLELWSASIRSGEPFEMTFPLRGADGSLRPFLTRVFPLRGANNEIVRWFGTNTDISQERAAREAAENATARIRRLQSLTALLARARTLHDVASAVVHEAVEATGAVTGMVALRDGETGDAVLLDEKGLPGSLRSDYARFSIGRDSPTAECLRTNAAIFVGTPGGQDGLLARYPALRDVWDMVGRSAVASVPIRLHDEAVAAMSFTFAEPQLFAAENQDFFFALAAQAAQAIARVRAFDAERGERRRSESIVEAITDGFATLDHELRFTYVNARAASMFGVAQSDLKGRDITAMNQAGDSPFLHLLRKVIAERAPGELEAFGSIMGRWLALRAYPADDGGVIVYFQDISNRRRQQDASLFLAEASRLLTSSPNYEVTLRNLARAAIPKLGDWCAIHLVESENNQGIPKLTRVALVHDDPGKLTIAAEYLRLSLVDLLRDRPRERARVMNGESLLIPVFTEEMYAGLASDSRQLELLRALGLSSMMVVPLAVAGRVLGTMTLCTAESQQHYDDVDLQLPQELAGRAANAVEHARLLERAEAGNAAKAEFLRTVSHELRQPLNAIGGLLQLWDLGLRGELNQTQRSDLDRIKRNQLQLAHLIEDLLSFARLDAGKLVVRQEEVRLASVLEGVTAAIALDLDSRGIIYRAEITDPSLVAMGDADRLHQVLVNLVTNALKATSPGDRIEVTCAGTEDGVEIRVRDTGTGIPAEKLEAIFTPFVQVGRALNQPRDGAGLGLAISRGLVEAMGGTLTAESIFGEESTFTVRLGTTSARSMDASTEVDSSR